MSDRKHAGFRTGILFMISATIMLPVLLMISVSLKHEGAVFEIPFRWFSDAIHWENYLAIAQKHRLQDYFLNSFFVATVATCINLFLSSMAGFSLAKYRYPGRDALFSAIVLLLLLPSQVLVVPLFMLMTSISLNDSLLAIILPYMTSPFAIFLMRQYFLSIPSDTMEAARVDGASEWQIYWRVILPQAKPVLGALGIFSFMFNWNNFMWPLIVLDSQSKFTVPLGIAMMPGEYSTPYNELMAAATLASLPVLMVFFLLQNHFISGMVIGAYVGKGRNLDATIK